MEGEPLILSYQSWRVYRLPCDNVVQSSAVRAVYQWRFYSWLYSSTVIITITYTAIDSRSFILTVDIIAYAVTKTSWYLSSGCLSCITVAEYQCAGSFVDVNGTCNGICASNQTHGTNHSPTTYRGGSKGYLSTQSARVAGGCELCGLNFHYLDKQSEAVG